MKITDSARMVRKTNMGKNKIRILTLVFGDILFLYAALFITLILRYGEEFYAELLEFHLLPFTIVFAIWVAVFYISGLYNLRGLRNNIEFLKIFISAVFAGGLITLAFFYYLTSWFAITPKTNLFIFIGVFTVLEILWRRNFNRRLAFAEAVYNVAFIGDGTVVEKIYVHISQNPELGYSIKCWIKETEIEKISASPEGFLEKNNVNLFVIPAHLKKNNELASALYVLLNKGVIIYDFSRFYELLFRAIPLEDLEEAWFLENIATPSPIYEFFKRGIDIIISIAALTITLPLWGAIAIAVAVTSGGPIIFKQARIGKNNKEFTLYKFRTMKAGSPHSWPGEKDERITYVGKFLRRTHLDELPQLINILRGDISIVGPRPDFVDFFKTLIKEIPYYEIRTIARPGLTGWAQVNNPIIASVEDTKERLCYDLYYLKNKSLALDLMIVLKTIKVLLTAKGR